ncbi:MAG: efflux transporter outer membrane subunit [Verrucomicrobiota bacterium]|jgi:NodT family efflux transporter outer membrane factor (OMF) lipoprotein
MVLSAWLGGCSFAPHYTRPAVETPARFKENLTTNDVWRVAQPSEAVARSNWWAVFNDDELNSLEAQLVVSNQNIAAAYANLLSARAIVRQAQAQYYPTLVANPSLTRQRQSQSLESSFGTNRSNPNSTVYDLALNGQWQPDFWGRVRNTVRSSAAQAQVSAADLENTRLTAQEELAADYFQLRGQDALEQLFDDTVVAYRQSLELTKVLFKTGIDSDQDVAQAETQLETTEAQDTNLQILRAQLEHAIAVLIGKPPSLFSIPRTPLKDSPPAVPAGLPSQLLERRPDIAAAERSVAAANYQIGVGRAAYFPNITLSAEGGYESAAVETLLDWPSRVWSLGANLSETIFDAGARAATVAQYRAAYEGSVAQYRQTVLTAFQQVEDNLASLRILNQEIQQQDIAVKSSERYLALALQRYRLGIDSYLNVITAQTTLLANRQTLVNLRTQQMTAAIQLIEALGGGWNVSQLPPK